MEKLIPWSQWVGIVQPHYYKGERGNKPYDLELMLGIYVLQHLYNLADDAARNEIIDSRAFSQFCGVDSSNQVPDGDTIGRFRHILEQNQLGEAFFTNVVESLQKCNLMLKKGTIVDSTLIAAPSSTKNKEKQRDPEAHSVKKGNQWYFGYKEHIGVDADSGLVHTVETTAANVHDSNMVAELLQGTEEDVYGDSGYLGAEKKDDAILVNNEGHPIRYQINKRPSQLKKASSERFELLKAIEHAKSSVRSKVEHVFCVIKRIFHFCKTRFRGRKNCISIAARCLHFCEFIPCSQSNEGCVTRFISRANSALELRFFSKLWVTEDDTAGFGAIMRGSPKKECWKQNARYGWENHRRPCKNE